MAFASIYYDEISQDSYESIRLSSIVGLDITEIKFSTGDPIVDYYDFCRFSYRTEGFLENNYVSWSSMLDHFLHDGDKYQMKYFRGDDEKFEFLSNSDMDKLSIRQIDELLNCICLEDHKNFNEVKEYINKQRNELSKEN